MSRLWIALARAYRKWKYVEDARQEGPAPASAPSPSPRDPCREVQRLREAVARQEARVADHRRNGCDALASEGEGLLRSLRSRLRLLEGC